MQSTARFLIIRQGTDINSQVNGFLKQVSGWEVVSISHQILQNGDTTVVIAFKAIGDIAETSRSLPETPEFVI